jgi:hypothetical protein
MLWPSLRPVLDLAHGQNDAEHAGDDARPGRHRGLGDGRPAPRSRGPCLDVRVHDGLEFVGLDVDGGENPHGVADKRQHFMIFLVLGEVAENGAFRRALHVLFNGHQAFAPDRHVKPGQGGQQFQIVGLARHHTAENGQGALEGGAQHFLGGAQHELPQGAAAAHEQFRGRGRKKQVEIALFQDEAARCSR